MTITLEIPDSREQELREITTRRGQDAETFFLSLMDEAILFGDMEPTPQDDPQEYADTIAGIQRGLDDFARGRHKPMEQVFAEMKVRHGIPD